MLSYYLLLTHVSYIHKRVDIASLLTNKKKFYTIYLISPFLCSFPGGSVGKESTCNAGDVGSIPGIDPLEIPWRRAWQPTPVFLPWRIPMDRGDWWATVHGGAKSQTRLSD